MIKYQLPSGKAAIQTDSSPLSETTYGYLASDKNNTIEELLRECLTMSIELHFYRTKYPHPYKNEPTEKESDESALDRAIRNYWKGV